MPPSAWPPVASAKPLDPTTRKDTMTTDTPGAPYGTEPRAHVPSAYVAAGLYEASPASLRPNGTQPRPFFDVATEEGQAAYTAYVADLKEREALKDFAYARHLADQGTSEGMFGDGI